MSVAFAIKFIVSPTAVDPVYLAHFSGVSGFGVRSMKLRLRLSVLCFQFPGARFTWPTALFYVLMSDPEFYAIGKIRKELMFANILLFLRI